MLFVYVFLHIHFLLCDKYYPIFKDLYSYFSHYNKAEIMVGLNGLEPSTSRLSGVRSNQLSYRPMCLWLLRSPYGSLKIKQLKTTSYSQTSICFFKKLLRKEVIQPHLPIRLPCYDFTPIIDPTFDGSLLNGQATGFGCYQLSWCDGRCVQGPGTYSPRYADPRLLAIPTSCRRVAACNPN